MKSSAWMGALLLAVATPAAHAEPPPGYPPDYAVTLAAARREGSVTVYAVTDLSAARYLISDFSALYPGVAVNYREINSVELHNRFLAEVEGNTASADVLWSSAMDLQVKLVNDGYALHYVSPEIPNLPSWAVWKEEAYGTTLEPAGFAYSTRQLAPGDVPRTHRDFVRVLDANSGRFKGRVITYAIENSGLGFLFATQDEKTSPSGWAAISQALGRSGARQVANTASMLESIASGESLLAYNLLGSYAYAKARTDPAIGFVYPSDYTLVGSRIAFINRRAAHPNAAKLWLDYLLSRRGQTVLANRCGLFALRTDVEGEMTLAVLMRSAGHSFKPIPIGPSLMTYLDRGKRRDFLGRWRQATQPAK